MEKNITLSLCMIVKDEVKNIGKMFKFGKIIYR